MGLLQMNFLHSLDVKIERVCEWVVNLARAEGFHELSDGIFD
jgi:hypothetical protein